MVARALDDGTRHHADGSGYTMMPNALLDHLMAELSGTEFKIVAYIARRTIGFGRVADAISLDQLAHGLRRADGTVLDRGTGESVASVKRALAGLRARGVVRSFRNRDAVRGDRPTTYSLDLAALERVAQSEPPPVAQSEPPPSSKRATPVAQIEPHKTKTGKKEGKERDDDDAIERAPSSSSSRPGVQIGLLGQPSEIRPPKRRLPADVEQACRAELARLAGKVTGRKIDDVVAALTAAWSVRGEEIGADRFVRRFAEAVDRTPGSAKRSYGGWLQGAIATSLLDESMDPLPGPAARAHATDVRTHGNRGWHQTYKRGEPLPDETPRLPPPPAIDPAFDERGPYRARPR